MFREIALELDKAHLRVQNDIDNIPGQASEVANDMLIATMLKERYSVQKRNENACRVLCLLSVIFMDTTV